MSLSSLYFLMYCVAYMESIVLIVKECCVDNRNFNFE